MNASNREPTISTLALEQSAKEQCLKKLVEAQKDGDTEAAHADADDAIIEFLRVLGHQDVANEWEKVPKWYA
jgi:hypothetical protein